MNLSSLFTEYLEHNEIMQVATVGNEAPWICTVHYVHDVDHTIYWTSTKIRRHSKEILANSKVAVTIVHNEKKKQALQMTGNAFQVALTDAERITNLYSAKFGYKQSRLEEILANTPEGRAFWVFIPELVEIWDEVHFSATPKQRIIL
jgi:uncharacterized protein YhbP (UPF0306 family)